MNFTALHSLPTVGEVHLALGTTIKVAGSQEAFRAVDFAANFAVAFTVGADAHSRIFYNR